MIYISKCVLSSPKLELWPKNSKKGGNGGLRGVRGGGEELGDAGVLEGGPVKKSAKLDEN